MWSAMPSIRLEELIASGPVERGFYVAEGTREMAPVVLKKLVGLMDAESAFQQEPFTHPSLSKLSYQPFRYWRRNSRIGQLIWLDSGHLFDSSFVLAEARKRRLDPTRILRAIKVDRPFTSFQLQQMLEHIPNPALWAFTSAVWWTPFIVVSDLMNFFCDPTFPENALVPAFRSFIMRLAFLRQRAIVLGFLDEHLVPQERRHLLAEMLKLARPVASEVWVS